MSRLFEPLKGVVEMTNKNGGKGKAKGVKVGKKKGVKVAAMSRKKGGNGKPKVPASNLGVVVRNAFNAFHPMHLPLHTPTGKYLTVKTRKTFNSTDYLSLFGPMTASATNDWTTGAGVTVASGASVMNGSVWKFLGSPLPHGGGIGEDGLVECVPAAYSVQIMSPSSVTTAKGVVAIGRLPASIDVPGASDTRTIASFSDAILSFGTPRYVTGAALCLTPMQVNCTPTNLTEYSNFTSVLPQTSDSAATSWHSGVSTPSGVPNFAAMAPIYIVNTGGENVQITICIEWRVRLSPFNPLHSSGTYHAPVSQDFLHKVMSYANSMATGVEEVGAVGALGYVMGGGVEAATGAALRYASGVAGRALPYILEAGALAIA